MTTFGKVEVLKDHVMCQSTSKFVMSSLIQEILCMLGQSVVFDEGSEILEELLNLKIPAKQIQRVSEYYGGRFAPLIKANSEAIIPQLESNGDDLVYVMMDGSMLWMRGDQRWREMKLARIFYKDQVVDIQKDRKEIFTSLYVSHLGGVDEFFPKLERHLTPYKNKVILGDGAAWIWNWAEDNYPGAIQILDYYHAKEKLVILANHQFADVDEQKRKKWIELRSKDLLNGQTHKVIRLLKSIKPTCEKAKEAKDTAIKYYSDHEDRMMYKHYRDRGLMIGSGPIEAAHRSVLQQRMKLSGQRWSIAGAQAISDLRCYRKAKAWDKVQLLIKRE